MMELAGAGSYAVADLRLLLLRLVGDPREEVSCHTPKIRGLRCCPHRHGTKTKTTNLW